MTITISSSSRKNAVQSFLIRLQSVVQFVAKYALSVVCFPITLIRLAAGFKKRLVRLIMGTPTESGQREHFVGEATEHTDARSRRFSIESALAPDPEEYGADIGHAILPESDPCYSDIVRLGKAMMRFANEEQFRLDAIESFVNNGRIVECLDHPTVMPQFLQCLEGAISLEDKKAILSATIDLSMVRSSHHMVNSEEYLQRFSEALENFLSKRWSTKKYVQSLVEDTLKTLFDSSKPIIPLALFTYPDIKFNIRKCINDYCDCLTQEVRNDFYDQIRLYVFFEKVQGEKLFQNFVDSLFFEGEEQQTLGVGQGNFKEKLSRFLGFSYNESLFLEHLNAIQEVINSKIIAPIICFFPVKYAHLPTNAFSVLELHPKNFQRLADSISFYDKVSDVVQKLKREHSDKVKALFAIKMSYYSEMLNSEISLDQYLIRYREQSKPWIKFFVFLESYLNHLASFDPSFLEQLYSDIAEACGAGCHVQQEAAMDRWCSKLIIATAATSSTNKKIDKEIGCSNLHLFFYLRMLREYVVQDCIHVHRQQSAREGIDFFGRVLTQLKWCTVHSYFHNSDRFLEQNRALFDNIETSMPTKLLQIVLERLTSRPSTMLIEDKTMHKEICSWIETFNAKTTIFGPFYTNDEQDQLAAHTVILYLIQHKVLAIDLEKLRDLNENIRDALVNGRLAAYM